MTARSPRGIPLSVFLVILSALPGLTGCGDADPAGPVSGRTGCDGTYTPIVFVHGFLEVSDAFANQAMRFAANGACPDRIFGFDWNTLGDFAAEGERLAAYIDAVLLETGAEQVDLIGHSMGTGLSAAYLANPARAAKVAHYANLAGLSAGAPPGGVPTLTLSSEEDYIAGVSHIVGAENVLLPGHDHLQVATSAETFGHLYRFFNDGREPRTTRMTPTPDVTLQGRLLTFAENLPARDHELRIYPVDPATGERLTAAPVASYRTDEEGSWGPFRAEIGRHYEFEVGSEDPFWPPIHYYREPLPRSCRLVHFRSFPDPSSLPGILLSLMPYDDGHTLLATLNINQAVVAGRDTLRVDGYEISTEEVTPAEKTAIAMFYFDLNGNGASDPGSPGGLFEAMAFIGAFDLYLPTAPERPVPMSFNGRDMAVRNWPSRSEGVTIAVFE